MRQIILASNSIQRKNLLKQLGLKFKVAKTKVREKRSLTHSCSQLVKENALNKAKSAARRFKTGIVIGADTVVLSGKKIWGKPKNIKAATAMLKILMRKPQWVYSGLAVIDIDNQKVFTDFEKTKVFMPRLTDSQITRYFSRVPPKKFAGSFDIQGLGGLFIKRIEGCFYNVVGLPLAKLYQMLKKIGIELLVILTAINLFGCATEYNVATGREDLILYGTDKEVAMGNSMSKEFEKKYKPLEDTAVQTRLQEIGEKIVAVSDRRDILYHFKAVEEEEVNAVSLPGGYVYIFKGLIDNIDSDDQLAGVIAHEVGHIVAKHSIKKLQAAMGYNILSILTAAGTDPDFSEGVDVAFIQIFTGYAKEDELLADRLAVRYAKKAGYNPQAMIDFLEKLKQIQQRKAPQQYSYWRTHPYTAERIGIIKQEIFGKMDFIDYYNKQTK